MNIAVEPLEVFIDEQLGQWPGSDARVARIARTLIDAAFYGERGVARRRPVISANGTPILLSFQENGRAEPPPFRLLAEPGLPSLCVSEQIDFALHTLGRIMNELQWQDAVQPVNALAQTLFPTSADAVDSWWGGLGLGCSLDRHGLELRLYCNVREGAVYDRWSRIAAAIALFGTYSEIAQPLRDLMEHLSARAIPAGIALCIRDGAVRGLRLYLALPEPDAASICELGSLSQDAREDITQICAVYPAVRPFSFGCVTAAFDFPISADQRNVDLRPARFKADFDCTPDPGAQCTTSAAMTQWLAQQHLRCELPANRLCAFLDLLQRTFGGWTADYMSYGRRGCAREITTYVLPAHYATLTSTEHV